MIEADSVDRRRSDERIAKLRADADAWLTEHSRSLAGGRSLPAPATRRGDDILAADLEAYVRDLGLREMDTTFAQQFVSNPGAGEIVKGHRIALARLGLAAYAGAAVRDPMTFSDAWTAERRADHILGRLAFLRARFARLGVREVTLWRGLAVEVPLQSNRRRSFVSATFAEVVARSHFDGGAGRPTRALVCQTVPVDGLFMTCLETGAMNDRFLEAEAVLIARPDDGWP